MAFKQAKEVKKINMNTGRDDKKKMHLLSSNKHEVKYAPLKWPGNQQQAAWSWL